MCWVVLALVWNACREEVDPEFRPRETNLLTGITWQLRSSTAEVIHYQLEGQNIRDTLLIIRRTYEGNLNNSAPPRLTRTFIDFADGQQTDVTNDSVIFNNRFDESTIQGTQMRFRWSSTDRCRQAGEWSWSWLRSAQMILRINAPGSNGEVFMAPEHNVRGDADYVISRLDENALQLGIREDVRLGDGRLITIYEELEFVAILMDPCLEVTQMNPLSGPAGTLVTMRGNLDLASRVSQVELIGPGITLVAENLRQDGSSFSFDIPRNAPLGPYIIRLQVRASYDLEAPQTFTVTP